MRRQFLAGCHGDAKFHASTGRSEWHSVVLVVSRILPIVFVVSCRSFGFPEICRVIDVMEKKCRELAIQASWMRGGSSNGLFFPNKTSPRIRKNVIGCCCLRSAGRTVIWYRLTASVGLHQATSTIVILSPSKRHDVDVDYLFGHVSSISH